MPSKPLLLLAIDPLHTDGLNLVPELDGDRLVVRLKGNADSTANEAFANFISTLHGEAQRLSVRDVTVNLTELYFMTSSCIRCFVTWVGFICESPPGRRYSLTFVLNPNLRWQKRNLEVLAQLSPGLLTFSEASC